MKIWLIGARGSIGTTAVAGIVAAQEGLLPLEGVLTARPDFARFDLAGFSEIRFGGCDLRPGDLGQAVLDSPHTRGTFDPRVLERVAEQLRAVPITIGIARGAGLAMEPLLGPGAAELRGERARDAVERISADLEAFAAGEPAVVVNIASTEGPHDPALDRWDLADFERALDADDPRIPASSLYAYAAIAAGHPYVNFTPSVGAALPALVELSHRRGVPTAGRDGKTGETLVKTALAPMFAIRALTVEGWYGTNILGNTDGLVLSHAENRATKVESKSGVLEGCLGYAPETRVRIDYFPPVQDHKVAWDFIAFRGWAGHRMRMQFIWEGTDAILAAPLVIDLARLVDLARRRGESGPVGALALFFKTPEGSTEMNLHRQYEALLAWLAERPVAAERAPSREAAPSYAGK